MDGGSLRQFGPQVKVSNWFDRHESFPLDNPKPNYSGASHYRTFGSSNSIIIPRTSTQDLLAQGVKGIDKRQKVAKSEVNFVTYPMNDFRFNRFMKANVDPPPLPPLTTTYGDFYKAPKPLIVKPICCEDKILDPLLNRIPKSDFEMLPSSPHMFMDDHLTMLSEGRKKINFLRQMRNSTYFMQQK